MYNRRIVRWKPQYAKNRSLKIYLYTVHWRNTFLAHDATNVNKLQMLLKIISQTVLYHCKKIIYEHFFKYIEITLNAVREHKHFLNKRCMAVAKNDH